MKLSRKMIAAFSAAVALAMAGTFVGCSSDDDNDEYGWITWSGKNATISADNSNGTSDKRAWKFEDKHYNAVETITISDYDKAQSSPVGYIFGYSAKDGKASFGLAGVRMKGSQPQLFVSWYKNIDVNYNVESAYDMNSQKNFGVANDQSFTTASDFAGYTGDLPAEYDVTKALAGASFADVNFNKTTTNSTKSFGGVIDLRSYDDGSYTIRAYAESAKAEEDRKASQCSSTGLLNNVVFLKNTDTATNNEVATNAIQIGNDSTVKSLEIPASVTGLTEAKKLKVGAYVNAVATTTVNATITVSDDRGADEVVEE